LAAVNLGAAFVALAQMCTAVPLDAPWNAKMAAKWNRINGGAVVAPQRAVQGRASPAGDRHRCSRCTRWPRAAKWASCSAGTESSLIRCRWVYGAVRSGVRAAAEMIQRERLSVA
jgi:hypothetical protein